MSRLQSEWPRPVFFLDKRGHLWFNSGCFNRYVLERPMAAKNLLDDLERKVEERYRREKAAIQLLRKAGSIDHSAIDEIPADLVPREPESNEATIEAARSEERRVGKECRSRW